jgi:hypothetical protein
VASDQSLCYGRGTPARFEGTGSLGLQRHWGSRMSGLDQRGWGLAKAAAAAALAAALAVCLGGCASRPPAPPPPPPQPPPPPVTWRDDRGDLLNWFLGHGRESRPLRAPDHSLALTWKGDERAGDSRYAKWATAHEHHRWDADNVYLVEDRTDNSAYVFSRGIMFQRRAQPGDHGRANDNLITWYDDDCKPTAGPKPFRHEWRFEGFRTHDFGGVVGVQEAAVVWYAWGTGREERFWYTWQHGWVRWQFIQDGKLTYDVIFNQPGEQVPPGQECWPRDRVRR